MDFRDDIDDDSFEGTIYCLMGKSASGKDSLYTRVMSSLCDESVPVRSIVIYTTRPQRTGEKDGREYYFIDEAQLQAYEDRGLVIERRDYDTQYGLWSYATIDDGQITGDNSYFVIETPEGVRSLEGYFGREHVVPMYVTIDDGVRLMRALTREMQQSEPKYDEMCRRFLSDMDDFAEIDRMCRRVLEAKAAGDAAVEALAAPDKRLRVFVNREVDECASEVSEEIRREVEGR